MGGKQQRGAKLYVKNAAVLTVTGLVLRAAGMFLRVYLAGRMGAGGMGLYQLIYTVYGLAATVATAGLSVAAARICAGLYGANRPAQARPAVTRLALFGALAGLAAALALAGLAQWAAQVWLEDIRAAAPLQILAPSLPFMSMSAVLRGYYLARRQVRPSSWSQLLEQAVRIGLAVALLGRAQGPEEACCAVVAANTISEAVSWAFLALCYWAGGRRTTGGSPAGPPAGLARKTAGILAPIAAGQYLTGVLHTVENVMVPACVAVFTHSRELALEQYGALKGMALPVLFFPFSFLGTLSTLLLPDITEAHVRGDTGLLRRLVDRVLLAAFTLGVLMGGLFSLLAQQVAQVLYGGGEVGFYLAVLGPLMPLMYMESMVDGILKGLDQQLATFRYATVDSVVRIALIAVLAPRMGMRGFLFVMLVSNLLTSLLNLRRLLAVTALPMRWGKWVLKPALSFALAAGCWRLLLAEGVAGRLGALPYALVAGAFVAAAYVLLLLLTGAVDAYDLRGRRTGHGSGE